MPSVILAEDSRTQAAMIRIQMENQGFQVQICRDGAEALKAVEKQAPDLVVTDLDMPEMNGVELVAALKRSRPQVPVLIMHTVGSEPAATAALRGGAVGYVLKETLAQDIGPAWRSVQAALPVESCAPCPVPSLLEANLEYTLSHDVGAITPIVAQVRSAIAAAGALDPNDNLRVAVAVSEAIRNAIDFGALELAATPFDSSAVSATPSRAERGQQSPYNQRRVRVRAAITSNAVACTVEVPGSRPVDFAALTAAASSDLKHHRGFVLIRHLMDEVNVDPQSNRLTMTKRRPR